MPTNKSNDEIAAAKIRKALKELEESVELLEEPMKVIAVVGILQFRKMAYKLESRVPDLSQSPGH